MFSFNRRQKKNDRVVITCIQPDADKCKNKKKRKEKKMFSYFKH